MSQTPFCWAGVYYLIASGFFSKIVNAKYKPWNKNYTAIAQEAIGAYSDKVRIYTDATE